MGCHRAPDDVLLWKIPDIFKLDYLIFPIHLQYVFVASFQLVLMLSVNRSHWMTVIVDSPWKCVKKISDLPNKARKHGSKSDSEEDDETSGSESESGEDEVSSELDESDGVESEESDLGPQYKM